MTPSDFNFVVGFMVAPGTVIQDILLAARNRAVVPICMTSDLLAFGGRSFSVNQAFIASEQDITFCRSAMTTKFHLYYIAYLRISYFGYAWSLK